MEGPTDEFASFVRQRRGTMTQVQFCAAAGIAPPTLRKMEHGLPPAVRILMRVAERLGDDLEIWLRPAGYEIPAPYVAEARAPYANPCGDDLYARCLAAVRQIEEGLAALRRELARGKGG